MILLKYYINYLNILKELEEFEEAINILIEELSMPYIPYQYESLFNAAYDEILLAKQEANYTLEAKNQIFSVDEIAVLLDKEECNDDLLYMALDQLQQLNVRMIIPAIERFLLNPKKHSFAKSIIMETLIEQQIDDEIQVFKNGVIYDFNPAYLPLVLSQNAYEGIYRLLERELEDENPSLLALCQEYLEYVLYSYFPKEIYDDEVEEALHKKALEGDTTAMIFWLKNRRPNDWRDKRENLQTINDVSQLFCVLKVN